MVRRLVPVSVWNIVALELPRVVRRCPRCDASRPFVSSGCFRVNAQKRRLDVWLVHRCSVCDETWNAPIAERVTPESLGADLERYHLNDDALARRLAFAVPGAASAVPFAVERSAPAAPPCAVRIRLVDPVAVRVDRLLAGELGVSRAEIARWAASGALGDVDPRRRVTDGLVLVLPRHGACEAAPA
jgi:hypothetical protein